jgi:hypothetical protein
MSVNRCLILLRVTCLRLKFSLVKLLTTPIEGAHGTSRFTMRATRRRRMQAEKYNPISFLLLWTRRGQIRKMSKEVTALSIGRCAQGLKGWGLGIKDLKKFNRAFRLRWLWLNWDLVDRLWKKLLKVFDETDRNLFFFLHQPSSRLAMERTLHSGKLSGLTGPPLETLPLICSG